MSAALTIPIPVWLDLICVWPVLLYRWFKYGYTYRRIYLGDGHFAILDLDDYYRLNKFQWYISGVRGKFYAVRSVIEGREKTTIRSMHREIKPAPKGILIDHQNCNPLDNRNANLRFATKSQNCCNKIINKAGCSSKYRGVSWDKNQKVWKSQLKVKGKYVFYGRFDNEIDAAKAYDQAAKKYHLEFSRLNFPENI